MTQWQRRKGVMLAYPFEEKRLARWKAPYIVQPKLDGVRCRVVFDEDGKPTLYSSEANEIVSVPHLNDELKNSHAAGMELDGELYVHGWSFEQIISVTSRTANLHPDSRKVEYHAFDTISGDDQASRIVHLGEWRNSSESVKLVPVALAGNLEDVMRIYNDFIRMGYEGIIVRNYLAPYIRKRSVYMMKFKPKKSDIYMVIGWKEEISKDGEPKGRLGALVCKTDVGDEFSVGTGLTDEQRVYLWARRQSLPGLYCKVEYQHVTPGKGVPRFPVFVEVG